MSALMEPQQQFDIEAALAAVRADVAMQREIDKVPQRRGMDARGEPFRSRPASWSTIEQRWQSVIDARENADSSYPARQALIDCMASLVEAMEAMAATMPQPHIPARRRSA